MTQQEELAALRLLAEKQKVLIEEQKTRLEQKKITVKPYVGTPRQPWMRAEMLAGLPQYVVEYVIPEGNRYSICGGKLKMVRKKLVRTEADFIPARLKVTYVMPQIARCSVCGTAKGENQICNFQKAAVPASPLSHSLSTPSLIAQVMYHKYVLGLPLARQEKDWYRMGLVLLRSDMANWVIRSAVCEDVQAAFFYYDRGQNGDIAAELLKGYRSS